MSIEKFDKKYLHSWELMRARERREECKEEELCLRISKISLWAVVGLLIIDLVCIHIF